MHGDDRPNDGAYSALFHGFTGFGNYRFNVSVNNQSGVTAPPDDLWPEFPNWTGAAVDPFKRTTQFWVNVGAAKLYLPMIYTGPTW